MFNREAAESLGSETLRFKMKRAPVYCAESRFQSPFATRT